MPKELEPFCFWCGGNLQYEFHSEPRPFYENKQKLCEGCVSLRGDGIFIFEVVQTDPGCGNPVMHNTTAYYTGRWCVVDDLTAAQIFSPETLAHVVIARLVGLRHDKYAKAKLDKYSPRTIQ